MKKIALVATLTAGLGFSAPPVPCTDLPGTGFGPEVKIDSAKLIPATAKTPEHWDVRGTILAGEPVRAEATGGLEQALLHGGQWRYGWGHQPGRRGQRS